MSDKLVIIDGNSLFYRSFYALPLLTNANGEYSNAVYGFAVQIVKIINDIKPTHIAVAFDAGKHTFRNDLYSGYKATRKPMPSELRSQLEPLKKMLKLMNIKMCEKPELEGDDVVGTLAKRFKDIQTLIFTADRDTLQLIDDTTSVYFTKKGTTELKIVDKQVLLEEQGITPSQVIDVKALQGDTSDNIPGVAGIGEKIAKNLVIKYGNLDGIYSNIDQITGKMREYLINGKDNAYLSYNLAKIKTDIDVDCNLEDCKYIFPFTPGVYEFFKNYQFKSLLKRPELFAENSEIKAVKTYELKEISNISDFEDFAEIFNKVDKFAAYIQKESINFSDGTVEFAISKVFWQQNNQAKAYILELFTNSKKKILFDCKVFMHFLHQYSIKLGENVFDLSIAKHLVDGVSVKSAADIIVDDEDNNSPASVIYNLEPEYFEALKTLNMEDLYYKIELPLTRVLFDMEVTGFKVDLDVLDSLSIKYRQELSGLESQICELAGEKFNVNSPKQLADILYNKLGLKHGKKMSTAAETLETLKDAHPIIPLILRYRKVAKLNSTYIEGFRPHIDSNGIVHTSFKQTLTNTGRLSSAEPNLQNIPVRSEDGKEVRSMFVARTKDCVLVDADYSQIELRLLAHMSGDEYFINAFKHNDDIHALTASHVFGCDIKDVNKDMRRIAKVVNFGIIYGISEFGLATDLNIKAKEAKKLIDEFYFSHPKVKQFMENAISNAKETGRANTLFGRSRKMLEITSSNYMVRSMAERAAQNMPLQGTAADIVKIAMIKVSQKLKEQNLKAKLILQVHDELIIDTPKAEESIVKQLVKDCMESAYNLAVPLTVDVASSYRWSDGH